MTDDSQGSSNQNMEGQDRSPNDKKARNRTCETARQQKVENQAGFTVDTFSYRHWSDYWTLGWGRWHEGTDRGYGRGVASHRGPNPRATWARDSSRSYKRESWGKQTKSNKVGKPPPLQSSPKGNKRPWPNEDLRSFLSARSSKMNDDDKSPRSQSGCKYGTTHSIWIRQRHGVAAPTQAV